MDIVRKNLLMFCSVLFLTGTSWCMEKNEKFMLLIQEWIDKKEIIRVYTQMAHDTKRSQDYPALGIKSATFFPEGKVTLFFGDLEDTMSVPYLLNLIDLINNEKNKEKSEKETQRTPAFLKAGSGSGLKKWSWPKKLTWPKKHTIS